MANGHAAGRAVWVLAVTQTLGYACIYYIFAALVVQWSDDFGWTKTKLAVGPTVAIVISGALAPLMGRFIDRGYGRLLLTGGSLVGAVALFGLSQVETQAQFVFAWALLGVAQAASLYEVCFALIIRRMGEQARAAIIRVTLVAGFASTISFPAAAALSDAYGWRVAVLVAAMVMLLVLVPLNFYATGILRRGTLTVTETAKKAETAALRTGLKSYRFWVLGLVLAALSLNHWMLIAFIIPMFTDLGASARMAVLAASIVGPAQVAGRLVLMRFDAAVSNAAVLVICLGAMFGAVVCLLLAGAAWPLVFGFAALQGAAIGVMTILRPVLIADVMGKEAYGAIAGSIQVMPLLAGAAAPLLGGILFGLGGASMLITAAAVILIFGSIGSVWLRRLHP